MGKKRFARNRQCGFGKNGNIQWNRKSRRFRKTPFAPTQGRTMDMLKHPGMADMPELLEKLGRLAQGRQKNRFHQRVLRHFASGACGSAGTLQGAGRCAGARAEQRRIGQTAGQGRRPAVNPYPVRAFVLAHLESVDFVVRFDEDTPAKLIEAVQPDVLVKGGDWSVDRIVGRESVQRRGGEVISLPLLQGYSTTALIEKIRRTAPGSR